MQTLVVTADVSRPDDVDRPSRNTRCISAVSTSCSTTPASTSQAAEDLASRIGGGVERQLEQCLPDVEGRVSGDEKGRRRQDHEYREHDVDLRRWFAAAYASSKGGIVQLTKSLALAWAPDDIQVNAILPGWLDTELTEKAREQIPGLHEGAGADGAVGDGPSRPNGGDRHLAREREAAIMSQVSPFRSMAAIRRRCEVVGSKIGGRR